MTDDGHPLAGKRILVVEDEYFVADDIRRALLGLQAEVIGPVPTMADGLALAETEGLDAAILDVNLDGVMSFPIADRLTERNVPFALATGYECGALPERYRSAALIAKPIVPLLAMAVLGRLTGSGESV